MPVRGNQFIVHPMLPTLYQDPTWNVEDHNRLETFRSRFPTTQIDLLMCLVWKQKAPGLCYAAHVEDALVKLLRG
jgi:hypothetical protein